MSADNTTCVFYHIKEYHAKSRDIEIEAGMRRTVLTYKAPKEGPNKGIKPGSVFVDHPQTKVSVQPEILAQALQAKFEDLQDMLIRDLVTSRFDWKQKKHTKITISTDEISVAKVAEFAAATGLGRLSKEAIEAWFNTIALLPVAEMIAAKRGCEPTDEAAVEGAASFKAHFLSLASTKVAIKRKTAEALLKVCDRLQEAAEEDEREDPMLAKLVDIVKPFTLDDSDIAEMI